MSEALSIPDWIPALPRAQRHGSGGPGSLPRLHVVNGCQGTTGAARPRPIARRVALKAARIAAASASVMIIMPGRMDVRTEGDKRPEVERRRSAWPLRQTRPASTTAGEQLHASGSDNT
jgi:hypothetical protein